MASQSDLESGGCCPFSPPRFVCCIEPLTESISEDVRLRGVTISGSGGVQVKASLYVDDITVFCWDPQSVRRLMRICNEFKLVSGAK
eukprot:g14693.t1